jgi:ribosomal protein S18 acetylase RimI-like enzyme
MNLVPYPTPVIRDPHLADERSWRQLWASYNSFYETDIPESVTAFTWQRILNPRSRVFARLAVLAGAVVGFSICVLHESTWTQTPVCYLEDLFVDAPHRRRGIGRLLIEDLLKLASARRWSRVYWHTRANNDQARLLYDKFVKSDDFVRYRLLLD